MELMNLRLTRVVIHEVFQRADDRTRVEPRHGNALEHLDGEAVDALRGRIVSAMANPTKSLQMAISKSDPGSMFHLASQLVDADDELFVTQSRQTAELLANAQISRKIPGGILVTFTGSAGAPPQRLVGIIKAEVHSGFTREQSEQGMALKYLKNLLLTAQTKLYKIGLFVEVSPEATGQLTDRWNSYIYDETLTLTNRDGAAQYFYEGFLGTSFLESSARNTKKFHDLTKSFIRRMEVPEEERIALHNALVTYLKVDQSPTVSIRGFADNYFADPVIRDIYEQHMIAENFPTVAVAKDISDVSSALKTRKLTFRNQVRLIAPAEGFDDLVRIEAIEGDPNSLGQRPRWTKITVRSDISEQE
ncbi:MAG: nucleoid-associated protein [Burkholderiales bacterium]